MLDRTNGRLTKLAVVWFFFGIETRGRTLEELDSVFNAKFPPKAARSKSTMVKRSDDNTQTIHRDAAGMRGGQTGAVGH